MTEAIEKAARRFAGAGIEVVCRPTPGAPSFIETYEDQVKAAPGMIRQVRETEKEMDAFIVACHCDPNLDVLKEVTSKPVIGIGEASMKIATMLGHRFSIISATKHSIPSKEALVRKYHLQEVLASIRTPDESLSSKSEEEQYYKAAKAAIDLDMAEVIVLGCAGMAGLDKRLQERLQVPVLDGVTCALILASGLVQYGISTSKIRRFNPDDAG